MSEIELVLSVEETFGVDIPDDVAQQLQTVGELEAWLLPHLGVRRAPAESLPCLNVVAFNRARRVLGKTLPNGERVRPQTPLESLLPPLQAPDARCALWNRLDANALALPSLRCAPPVEEALGAALLFGLLFSPIGALLLGLIFEPMPFWMGIGVGLYALGFITAAKGVMKLVKPLAVHAPLQTVGEVAEYAVTHRYWKLADERGAWSEGEVWRVLQKLIAREGAVEADAVRRDISWDELGIGDY